MAVQKVVICGFGLIGGSIALAIQKHSKTTEIVAVDRPTVVRKARNQKKFKISFTGALKAAVTDADIIILSSPLSANETMLRQLAKLSSVNKVLIIDTGSVKQSIAKLGKSLRYHGNTQFLATHPMAGKEVAGFANAEAGLFAGRIWFIDANTKLNKANQQRLKWLMKITQAKPVAIESGTHDAIISEQSHLPQILSSVLGAQMSPELLPLSGPGLKTMLRLAGSPYPLWNEIIKANRKNIVQSLQLYRDNLNKVIGTIAKNGSLDDLFEEANRSYRCL